MGIQYRIVKRANNMARKNDEQYIMQAVHTGIVDQEQLANEVSSQCTVHPADVEAVITAMSLQMKFHLGEGKVVVLDKLGRFKLGFQGVAQPNPNALQEKDIKKFYINFQPALSIKKWLKAGINVFKEP